MTSYILIAVTASALQTGPIYLGTFSEVEACTDAAKTIAADAKKTDVVLPYAASLTLRCLPTQGPTTQELLNCSRQNNFSCNKPAPLVVKP